MGIAHVLNEFLKKFPDVKAASKYLVSRRWRNVVVCPFCGSVERIQTRKIDGFYRFFERSHIPLDKWLYTMYLLAASHKEVSSLQLSKEINITQKTAWFMLQRIREACGNNADAGLLSGIVEVDEIYIGDKESNKHAGKKLNTGRRTVGKIAVLGIRERDSEVLATATVPNNTKTETTQSGLIKFVKEGAVLYTDEHISYRYLSLMHKVLNYIGKHLQRYVNEFTYRLNESNIKVQTTGSIDSLLKESNGIRLTYYSLVGGYK